MSESILPARGPQAYAYARVSDNKQAVHDESIPGQKQRCEHYYKYRLEPQGIGWQGVFFDSFGVSASKLAFDKRPAGIKLMQVMQPGDHLICDKVDRLWRSTQDFANLLEWFKKHEIFTHFVNLGFDTSTHTGKFMLSLVVAIAELESGQLSERVSLRNEWARRNGRPTTATPPFGTKIVLRGGREKHKILIWDENLRGTMAEIVRLRSEEGWRWESIATHLEKHFAALHNRPYSTSAFYKRSWPRERVIDCFCVEVFYRDHSIHSVCEIPKGIRDLARAYAAKYELLYGSTTSKTILMKKHLVQAKGATIYDKWLASWQQEKERYAVSEPDLHEVE